MCFFEDFPGVESAIPDGERFGIHRLLGTGHGIVSAHPSAPFIAIKSQPITLDGAPGQRLWSRSATQPEVWDTDDEANGDGS